MRKYTDWNLEEEPGMFDIIKRIITYILILGFCVGTWAFIIWFLTL